MTGIGQGLRPLATRLAPVAVPPAGLALRIRARESERAALARRLGLEAVERLEADLVARPWRGRGLLVEGRLTARIVQTCVVSLDPFPVTIDEPIAEHFWPSDEDRPSRREVVVDVEASEEPERFAGGEIDIGALVADTLAVAIDPYPRRPDARLEIAADAESPAQPQSELRGRAAARADARAPHRDGE